MATQHLSTYLNDHLGGAVAALEMIAHLRQAHPNRIDGDALDHVETEIREDRGLLESLMKRLGISHSASRRAAGWLAERASRLKLAVDDPSNGDLRAFETIELISLGIEGKISLWTTLSSVASTNPVLSGLDYENLIARARGQRQAMEAMHVSAAREALVDSRSPQPR